MKKFNVSSNFLILMMLVFIGYQQFINNELLKKLVQPKHFYFATTEDGRLHPMESLNQPSINSNEVNELVKKVLTKLFNLDKKKYRDQLSAASRYFTKRGWESFASWLNKNKLNNRLDSGDINKIELKETGSVQIIKEEEMQGRYQWIIHVPITLAVDSEIKKYNLNILLVRVARLEAPQQVGVEQISFDEVVE